MHKRDIAVGVLIRDWWIHAFAQASRAIGAGQKRQRRSRQRGDAVGADVVAAFGRKELSEVRGRYVRLSG